MRNNLVNRLLVPSILVSMVAIAGCNLFETDGDVGNTDFAAFERFSETIPVDQRIRIRLSGINGTVVILGQSGSASIVVAGERRVESESQSDAENHLDDIEVRIRETSDEVIVETFQPENSRGRNYTVDYEITIPADFDVSVNDINGNVFVEDVENASVNLVNGDVRLRNVRTDSYVDLTNGTIDSFHSLPPDDVDFKTVNGGIQLGIPEATSASFIATVVNGSVSVSNLDLHNRVSTPTETTGILGSGDGRIQLALVNGNILAGGH